MLTTLPPLPLQLLQLLQLLLLLTPAYTVFPLTGWGSCSDQVTEVTQERAVHLSSENYPLSYPRGACQRRRLRPSVSSHSVSVVCTDLDLDSLVVPWFGWRLWGDFLQFPGVGMAYGNEGYQCETAPLAMHARPGQELPLEFTANYLIQRRGYSCIARAVDEDALRSRQTHAAMRKERADCGRSRVRRIVDGEDAKPGELPFLVYIVTRTSDNKKLYCAASVISRRFLLTAAHCLERGVWVELRLGTLDVSKPNGTSISMNTTRFQQHPEWSIAQFSRNHDIGLIEMPENITFTDYIQPICLPSILELEDQQVGEEAAVAGWGKKTQSQHGGSFILQVGKVRVISNCQCSQRWPFQVTPLKMCTVGTTGRQTHCTGDSGGPLMLQLAGRWTQVGISSFTSAAGCDATSDPAGYTRVSGYLSWIQHNTDVDVYSM